MFTPFDPPSMMIIQRIEMLLKDNIYTLALKTQQRLLWGGTLDFVRKEILQINLQTCCHEIHFRLQQGLAPWPEDISLWYLVTIYTNTFPLFVQINFTIFTNTIYNLDKYILQLSSAWRRDPKTFPGDIFLCRCSAPCWLERRWLFLCFPFFHYQFPCFYTCQL